MSFDGSSQIRKSWGPFEFSQRDTVVTVANMVNITDLCLGTFLILCGFSLSLFNFRRVTKGTVSFSSMLLSENLILMAIGIAYVSRSVYSLNPTNIEDDFDVEERALTFDIYRTNDMNCGFQTLLLSYGPFVVSTVNSFLTLIIDNYMQYKILENLKEKQDESVVREVTENDSGRKLNLSICNGWNKYLSSVTIALQWVVPILTALAMYPITVEEMSMSQARNLDGLCMAMLDLGPDGCNMTNTTDYNIDLPKYIQSPINYFEILDNEVKTNDTNLVDTVLKNVFTIINNFNNNTNLVPTIIKTARRPKMNENCLKMCYTDNKSILLYMLILGFVTFFVPITISTIILTKIHVLEVKKTGMKIYATRELLCNILFWTPVMLDTLFSLTLCSYSMHGKRTSTFNVIANVYQALKSFVNTKYIKDNVIVPI